MKRLVKVTNGWLELDFQTYRSVPKFLRRISVPDGYGVIVTRYDSDGWSVGDPESPGSGWRAGTGSELSEFLVEFTGITQQEAEAIADETIAEWKGRDVGEPFRRVVSAHAQMLGDPHRASGVIPERWPRRASVCDIRGRRGV